MISRGTARSTFTVIAWMLIGALVPYWVGTGPDKLNQLDYILALIMVACGLNIALGFAGILFLGPSALLATGAYAAAILAQHHTAFQSLPAMSLVAIVAAMVLAALLAIPSL